MKFKVAKTALLQGLQVVQNIVGVRSTLPILANVLLSCEKKQISLTTTDLDITVRSKVEADVSKAGATTLPARRLFSIIRELPDAMIEFETDDKHASAIQCEASFFKIIGLSEDEFPPAPKAEGKFSYNMDQGVFREMLRKTAYAASMDETRYVLNGVFLSFKDGKLTMVATDGRRLGLVEHEVEFPREADMDMILPSKAVQELAHTLGDEGPLKIHASENRVVFAFGETLLSCKLIEGTYPNYKQVIPAECEERVAVERESLLTAVRRTALLSSDKASAMKFTFGKNRLTVSINTPDVGEARESIPVKYSGKELSIAFNPEYMIAPLKNLDDDEIYIELTDDMSPGVIKCDIPFVYVIMPMRIT